MAIETACYVEIERPISDVFRLTNDHVAEWSLIVVEEEVLEETSERVGTRFRTVTEDRGKRMEFEGLVTASEPPRYSAVSMRGRWFDIEAEYLFDELTPERTRVTQRSRVYGKGLVKLILAMTGWAMRRANCQALDKELESLKRFCETSTVPESSAS